MTLCADDGKTACCFNLGAELDIGTTTGHVGGNGHGSEHALLNVLVAIFVGDGHAAHGATACFGHDLSLFLVIFGVQHLVRDVAELEHA